MKTVFTFLLWLVLPLFVFAQNAIDASISFATFQDRGNGYIEVYLHILGPSAGLSPLSDTSGQAILDVVVLFKKGEEVVKFDKYRLNGPVTSKPIDFVDLKRYALANGEYSLEVSVEDKVNLGNAKKYQSPVSINYSADALAISDISLLASVKNLTPGNESNPMAKGKFIFEQMPTNYYDKNSELLLFYNEIYNTDKAIGDDFLQTIFIDNADTKDREEKIAVAHKRKQSEPMIGAVQQVDIKELPTGNYNIVIEVRNKNRDLLTKKSMPFQRSNPYFKVSTDEITSGKLSLNDEFVGKLSVDELVYSLKAIMMQVDKGDGEHVKMITSERNLNAMRLYLFSYWVKENHNNPEAAYNAYMKVARQVDESFANGFGRGFETDRGYIFLKYGAPNNTVFEENDPSAPPYEIWFYNQFPKTGQNNVKFVFYNPSLVTNGHVLLHSTARGENNNPRWEIELYRDAPNEIQGGDFMDGTQMQSNINRHARQLFESF
ncbi:MAG: GWxTD domain-containing protein [Saprospiraceae bacterium]|nr:GWxTD domain-containing protein [Saprospiraceae bacterium]